MTKVVLNPRAIADLGKKPALTDSVGDQVADRARQAAPKDSGAGAASIHAETEVDGKSAVTRISWDAANYYLLFHEIGTSKMPARPFLRPALDGKYTV